VSTKTNRIGFYIAFDRETNQDLVSKSTHENEERPEEQVVQELEQSEQQWKQL
jgi:hypothetical protein